MLIREPAAINPLPPLLRLVETESAGVSVVPPLVALSEREGGTRQAARAVQPGPRVLNWMATIRHPAGVLNPQVVPA